MKNKKNIILSKLDLENIKGGKENCNGLLSTFENENEKILPCLIGCKEGCKSGCHNNCKDAKICASVI